VEVLKVKHLVIFWAILPQRSIDVFQFVFDALELMVARALKDSR
jgi:hypothetical protein